MKLHSWILTTIINISSLLPCYGSEVLKGGGEISQSSQIRRDGILLQQILIENNHDPEAYDIRYSQLIDPMMESLQPDTTSKELTSYQKIKEVYEKAKNDKKLNLSRMTWLTGEMSAALTSKDHPSESIDSIVGNIIESFQNRLGFLDVEAMELRGMAPAYTRLRTASLFFAPLPVYIGSSAFSLDDYFWATSQGLCLYSINSAMGKGHVVHGGVFSHPLERTAHDLGHFLAQWPYDQSDGRYSLSQEKIKTYQYYASWWKKLAGATLELLESDRLSAEDKQRLKVMMFMVMHENDGRTIPDILSGFSASSVAEVALMAAYDWSDSVLSKIQPGHFPKSPVTIYRQKFYRDCAYLLINAGLAVYEDFGVSGSKLGTDYDLNKLQSKLGTLYDWFISNLDHEGMLRSPFDKIEENSREG